MQLYPYQQVGSDFLASRERALLADRMRLGKTIQAIDAAKRLNVQATVVVCPASAVPNWEAEWETWEGPGKLHAISYASLVRRDWQTWGPDLVILDESHYAKNPKAKRTKAALGLAQKAPLAWLLTATPMPNDPTELWPMIHYLWPELAEMAGCYNKYQWMHRFCLTRPTDYGPKPYMVRNGALLRRLLDRIMLRRTVEDVEIELPPLRVDLFRLPKDAVDLTEYDRLEALDADEEVDEEVYSPTMRRVLGEAKAPAIARQIIEELESGQYDKIVVLYYHNSVRDIFHDHFCGAGIEYVGFGGDTPQKDREAARREFQEGHYPIFLAQQTAAGIAINLSAADEIVLVEPAWSPDDNRQAIARIRAIGQTAPCRARVFAVSGTIDTAVIGTITNKVRMQEEAGLKP